MTKLTYLPLSSREVDKIVKIIVTGFATPSRWCNKTC